MSDEALKRIAPEEWERYEAKAYGPAGLFYARALIAKLVAAVEERIDMSVCNKRCPAYQPFTTIFESPGRAYGGCVVAYTDSNFHKDRAPLGEACPFYRREEAGDE